jgi:hypothetical protein
MKVTKQEWPNEMVKQCVESTGGTSFVPFAGETVEKSQPGFGLSIFWNEPRKPWKPFIVMDIWHWHIQIGWLF